MEAGLLCGDIQETFIKRKKTYFKKNPNIFQHSRKHDPENIFFNLKMYLEQDGKLSVVNLTMDNESCIIFSNWKMMKNKVTKIS